MAYIVRYKTRKYEGGKWDTLKTEYYKHPKTKKLVSYPIKFKTKTAARKSMSQIGRKRGKYYLSHGQRPYKVVPYKRKRKKRKK